MSCTQTVDNLLCLYEYFCQIWTIMAILDVLGNLRHLWWFCEFLAVYVHDCNCGQFGAFLYFGVILMILPFCIPFFLLQFWALWWFGCVLANFGSFEYFVFFWHCVFFVFVFNQDYIFWHVGKLWVADWMTYDQLTNYLEKRGYFSNPPKKFCTNFFGVHRTSFWSNKY